MRRRRSVGGTFVLLCSGALFAPSSSSWIALAKLISTADSSLSPSSPSEKTKVRDKNETTQSVCSTYLAPSTIPGAGLGVFSSRAYTKGDQVTHGDLVVPLWDMELHHDWSEDIFLWDEYTWAPHIFPTMQLQEAQNHKFVHGASLGFGGLPNCWLPLVNTEDQGTSIGWSGWISTETIKSKSSAGLGAFTPYHSRAFYAKTNIPQGMELFVNYGEKYFKSREYRMPLRKDYEAADHLLDLFSALKEWIFEEVAESGREYTRLTNELWDILQSTTQIWAESRVFMALPDDEMVGELLLDNGGTAYKEYNRSIRSIDWLHEHGSCIDNIRDGVSTIPHAGRGAFATRDIAKGQVVSPVPLIHIGDAKVLDIYPIDPVTNKSLRNETAIHSQLMKNYCFGRSEFSSILLCPYGLLVALINHSSKSPNVRLEWSKSMRHPEWKDQQPHQWSQTRYAGLSMDFVALRDIREGEEVLLDYGNMWEQAWERHVQICPSTSFIPAVEINANTSLKMEYLTRNRPFDPKEQRLLCNSKLIMARQKGLRLLEKKEYLCEILLIHEVESNGHQCRPTTFATKLMKQRTTDSICYVSQEAFIWSAEHDIFSFEDLPYSRYHHQPWSFRHEIGIPDDIFPEAWKNKNEMVRR